MAAREPLLKIEDLWVSVEGKDILKGVNLTINPGEVHAIMGRNGSGKSTLSYTLMGHPRYQITRGSILFKGEEIGDLPPNERAKKVWHWHFSIPSPFQAFRFQISCAPL